MKHVRQTRYHAEIWVVGLAHVVTVHVGRHCLTELIANEGDMLPKLGLATSFRFRGERDYAHSFDSGMKYILSTQVERMTPNLFPSSHRDLLDYGQRRSMFQSFGEWESDGLDPFTFIDHEAREREFHIHAYHVFPEEMTLLRTQSIFEIAPRK